MNASAQLSSKDILRLKWLLGNVIALMALWASVSLSGSSIPIVGIVGVIIIICMLKPSISGRWIVPNMGKIVGLILTISILDFVVNGANFLNPLIRLVVFLILIRTLSYRTRREDMQVLLLSLFLMVLTGVMTVSLLFGVQMLVFSPIAMLFLFFVNLAEDSKDDLLSFRDWEGFSIGRFVGRVLGSMDRAFVVLSGALFIVLVVISGAIFVLIPRFQIDQNIPFLQPQSQAMSGFTENIEFGEVSEIVEDNSVAVRLDAPNRDAIPNNPYWRMLVADEYINGAFRVSSSAMEARYLESPGAPSAEYWRNFAGAYQLGETRVMSGEWTFYMEGSISRYIPHLGPFLKIRFPKEVRMLSNVATRTYNTDRVSSSVFSYQIESMFPADRWAPHPREAELLPGASPVIAAPDSDIMQAVEFPMTQLGLSLFPVDVDILNRFIAEIREGAPSDLNAEAFARRVISWLESRHGYSLRPEIDSDIGDPVIRWMQSRGSGHCELFAAAMTLLCRGAGIPARVVVGFNGGSWNPVEEYFIIRNRNAHAWVEIFDGESWLRFDPTPNAQAISELAADGQTTIISEEAGWDAWVDSLRIVWYRQIVNFDSASQEALVTLFGQALKESLQEFTQGIREFFERLGVSWKLTLENNSWWRPVLITLALIGAVSIFLRRRAQWFWQMQKMRMWMRGSGDVYAPLRRQATKWLERLHARQSKTENISEIELSLEAIRYGPRPDLLRPFEVFQTAKRALKNSK